MDDAWMMMDDAWTMHGGWRRLEFQSASSTGSFMVVLGEDGGPCVCVQQCNKIKLDWIKLD